MHEHEHKHEYLPDVLHVVSVIYLTLPYLTSPYLTSGTAIAKIQQKNRMLGYGTGTGTGTVREGKGRYTGYLDTYRLDI